MERYLKLKLPGGQFVNVGVSRSRTMSAIRGKNTKTTERTLRMALSRTGIRGWELHPRDILGKPDLYFRQQRLAVFLDGCFWHGCAKCGHIPKTRRPFWRAKILRNKERDKVNARKLRQSKIRVVRVWEHSLSNKDGCRQVVAKIVRVIHEHRDAEQIIQRTLRSLPNEQKL